MNCPSCQAENAADATTCSQCGRSLRAASPSRRSAARRRAGNNADASVADDSDNPVAWRAYRVALWSLVPGLGLLLGPAAILLGRSAMNAVGEDASARNRARAACVFGILVTLTQWLGTALIIYGWNR